MANKWGGRNSYTQGSGGSKKGRSDATIEVNVEVERAKKNIADIEARMFIMGNRVDGAFNKSQNSIGKFSQAIQGITGNFTRLLTVMGGFISIRGVMQGLSGFVNQLIEVNRVFMGFTASMSVIKGSVGAAGKEYKFLLDMANRLGTSVEATISNYHRLAAALKNVDKSGELTRHLFSAISQAAVVLHSKGRDVHLIFEAIQQMASKGKLSLEELQRQLGNTLPGAVSMAARGMMESQEYIAAGIKTATEAERKLREQIEKGTINVYEFLARLANQLKKEYGQGVGIASAQITAHINRMKNAWFEFKRVIGSSDAMAGLVEMVREITALFNDEAIRGAEGLGKSFGEIFRNIADWISKLSSDDIKEFFETVNVSILSTIIITEEFFEVFKGFGGNDMETPLLDFVQFVATAMANLVDVIRLAVIQIQLMFNNLIVAWTDIQQKLTGNSLQQAAIGSVNSFERWLGKDLPGKKNRADYVRFQGDLSSTSDQAKRDNIGLTEEFDAITRGKGATGRVTAGFNNARNNLLANKYGVVTPGLNFSIPGVPQEQGPGDMRMPGAMGTTPAWITSPPGNRKAGSTADAAAAYVNPLNNADLQAQLDAIAANSGAPVSGKKDGKGKKKGGGGGGKSMADKADDMFLREHTRLTKDLAVAQNEYQNILDNKNISEGKNVAQMRSLIATDERYIILSKEKQNNLMSQAKALDDMEIKIENAIKAQKAWNDALVEGYDAESRIAELRATGYENQFRKETEALNSFKKGGENETADEVAQQRILAASRKQDDDARNLSMQQMISSTRMANEELIFQASLYGLSAREIERMTAFREIDLWTQQQMVGASEEMRLKYLQIAEVLKADVSNAFDQVAAKQNDMLSGIKAAMAGYIDQYGNMAEGMNQVTVNALGGMEDAFVSFAETGKLSFKELADSIAKDLIRLIARYLIVMMLQAATGLMPKGGATTAGNIGSFATVGPGVVGPRFAKGGVFTGGKETEFFAKGGIVSSPTMFSMGAKKNGVMGERGPEAIMPLSRDSSGSLGVKAVGGGGGESAVLNLKVEVYQGEGSGVKTEKAKGENGDILKIFIGEVAADIQRGGQVAKSLTATYGLSRKAKSFS